METEDKTGISALEAGKAIHSILEGSGGVHAVALSRREINNLTLKTLDIIFDIASLGVCLNNEKVEKTVRERLTDTLLCINIMIEVTDEMKKTMPPADDEETAEKYYNVFAERVNELLIARRPKN